MRTCDACGREYSSHRPVCEYCWYDHGKMPFMVKTPVEIFEPYGGGGGIYYAREDEPMRPSGKWDGGTTDGE